MNHFYSSGKRSKRLVAAILLAAFFALFTACGKKSPGITQQDIVDDYAKIALQKETMSLRMEQAVEASEAWLTQEFNSDETDAALEKIYNQIADEYNALESYELSDEMKQALEKYDIDPVDYVVTADDRINVFYDDAQSIAYLRAYLALNAADEMKAYLDIQREICSIEDEYNAWTINYLFCSWSGDALDYVQENIIDKLAEEHQLSEWLTEKDEIEDKAMECLDQLEILNQEMKLQIEWDRLQIEQEYAK